MFYKNVKQKLFNNDRIHFFYILMFFLIFVTGAAVRLHSLDRSLWLDEAWVANSVLTNTFYETVYYDSWLQTSPPLFLLILRWTAYSVADSPEALRLVPALFGVLSILAMIYLSLRLLQPIFAVIATLLFTFSPPLVEVTQSLKQYSSDVFVSLFLLALSHEYLRKRSVNHLYVTIFMFVILSFLSYSSIFFVPTILYALIFDRNNSEEEHWSRPKINVRTNELIAVIICATFVALTNYFAFIIPNKNESLHEFFKTGFVNSSTTHDIYTFYSKLWEIIIGSFFFYHYDAYMNMVFSFLNTKKIVFLVIISGLFGLIWSKKGNIAGYESIIVLLFPFISVLACNIFGMYPLGAARLTLFLFPIFVLLFTFGLQFISEHIYSFFLRNNNNQIYFPKIKNTIGIIMLLLLVFLLSLRIYEKPKPFVFNEPIEDVRGSMAYLSKNSRKEDILYIHSSMNEQFKLYAKFYQIRSDIIIQGDIGWPCCPRGRKTDRLLMSEQFMPNEVRQLKFNGRSYILRLFFTNRHYHWEYFKRNDPDLFRSYLADIGCFHVSSVDQFKNIRIDEYFCKSISRKLSY